MLFACHSHAICMCSHVSYVIRMSLVCQPYVTLMQSYVIRMSTVCHSYAVVCHPYVNRMHSYVIRMSLVCTRMSSICHSHATRMSVVSTRMSFVCHSYVLVCHPYVTCLWFYHEPFISNLITWNLSKSIFYIRISTKKQAFDFFKRNSFTNSCLKFLCVGKLIASLINFKFLAKIWRQFTWVFIHLMILKLVDLNS